MRNAESNDKSAARTGACVFNLLANIHFRVTRLLLNVNIGVLFTLMGLAAIVALLLTAQAFWDWQRQKKACDRSMKIVWCRYSNWPKLPSSC
jgi:hypothetical protein